MQIDLKQIPAVIMNQVLKRHPLSIRHIREYLKTPIPQRQGKLQNHSIVSSASYVPNVTVSARHYEDPLAVNHYMTYSPRLDRKKGGSS